MKFHKLHIYLQFLIFVQYCRKYHIAWYENLVNYIRACLITKETIPWSYNQLPSLTISSGNERTKVVNVASTIFFEDPLLRNSTEKQLIGHNSKLFSVPVTYQKSSFSFISSKLSVRHVKSRFYNFPFPSLFVFFCFLLLLYRIDLLTYRRGQVLSASSVIYSKIASQGVKSPEEQTSQYFGGRE